MKFIVGEYHPVLAGSSKVVRDIMESIGLKVDYQAMDNATWRATRADSENWDALITASVGFYHPYLGATAHLTGRSSTCGWNASGLRSEGRSPDLNFGGVRAKEYFALTPLACPSTVSI